MYCLRIFLSLMMSETVEQKEIFGKEVICGQDLMSLPLKLPKYDRGHSTEEEYNQAAKRAKTAAAEEGDRLRSTVNDFLKQQAGVVA